MWQGPQEEAPGSVRRQRERGNVGRSLTWFPREGGAGRLAGFGLDGWRNPGGAWGVGAVSGCLVPGLGNGAGGQWPGVW